MREIEEQSRNHSLSSSTQNGRVNAAHARKKKRLDEEFERLLESIELKRGVISGFDVQAGNKASGRDMKEAEMVDLEKELVQILVEQQKAVLSLVEDGRIIDEKCKEVIKKVKLPWPPIEEPTAQDVLIILKKIEGKP